MFASSFVIAAFFVFILFSFRFFLIFFLWRWLGLYLFIFLFFDDHLFLILNILFLNFILFYYLCMSILFQFHTLFFNLCLLRLISYLLFFFVTIFWFTVTAAFIVIMIYQILICHCLSPKIYVYCKLFTSCWLHWRTI